MPLPPDRREGRSATVELDPQLHDELLQTMEDEQASPGNLAYLEQMTRICKQG